jgi:hypothetical protein
MQYKNGLNFIGRNQFWFLNGQLHREDGPAITYLDGTKEWFFNGKRHRKDGPAIERETINPNVFDIYNPKTGFHERESIGYEWYFNGEKIDCTTQEEFERLMRLKSFW